VTSSPMPQPQLEFERAVGGAIAVAVRTVAERSFFACVDRCDRPHLDDTNAEWLVATVHFDDGPVQGTLACSLPPDLAQRLFDAFSGRDPATPLPPREQLDDLVGEFSNMVCGTWLTRTDGRCAFRLTPPVVSRVRRPAVDASRREWMVVNDRPVAIDWDVAHARGTAAATMSGR
jgi:CheY-specific phosphatase CheX